MSRGFPWDVLGIDATDDRKAIRSAYAAQLKGINPDEDIAGYARLRDARDHALELAQQGVAHAPAPGTAATDLPPDATRDAAADPQVDPAEPQDDKPARFLAILFPDNEYSSFALIREEYEDAAPLMRAIIAQAQESSIEQQAGIEDWLAHFLASAWPRSSKLVEEAVAAFGWDRNAGRIDEHAAVAFLNARRGSMEFIAKLEQPEHEWHQAYVELRSPGPPSREHPMSGDPHSILSLLAFIRGNHPELEGNFDENRVAAYANLSAVSGESRYAEEGDTGIPWNGGAMALVAIFIVIRAISGMFDTGESTPYSEVPVYSESRPAFSEVERQLIIDRLFEEGVDYDVLASDAPSIFEGFGRLASTGLSDESVETFSYWQMRRLLRSEIARAAAHVPFEELVAIKQLQLEMLRAARDKGDGDACANVMFGAGLPDHILMEEEFLARERQLARRLLDAGMLRPNDAEFPQSAAIPGEVVEQAMESGGFSEARFAELATGEGTSLEQCNFKIALLEAILRQPGTVSDDLLRMR